MELALGTVQFGLRYGVAGRGAPVPESEVRQILSRAWSLGIRTLDTAAAYGDIEQRLRRLAGDHGFRVITKLPPMPEIVPSDVHSWIESCLNSAHSRLGPLLSAVMFHRPDDLTRHGVSAWRPCEDFAAQHAISLGASCYAPEELRGLTSTYPLTIAQLPGNALDQRVAKHGALPSGVQIHVRSAFLQGLLLLDPTAGVNRVPLAEQPLVNWHQWCERQTMAPLHAALGIVKGFHGVGHCVVGVDHLAQLESIVEAWHQAPVLAVAELETDNVDAIDPRRWPPARNPS